MRPPVRPQSALRAPLNGLLGTESYVRILRLLALSRQPMSNAVIARRTELNDTGVRRSVKELIERGIIDSLGTGNRHIYCLRHSHPLASPLTALFIAESERFEAVLEGIRRAIRSLSPPPRAAWIQGPVATETDEIGDPVVLGVLSSPRETDHVADRLTGALSELQRENDVTIQVWVITMADFHILEEEQQAAIRESIPLFGHLPQTPWGPAQASWRWLLPRSHQDLDDWSLFLSRRIADKLAQEPSLIQSALKYIEKRGPTASPQERKELAEWKDILRTMSVPRLRRFLTEDSERATRLRQSLPFVDALSLDEIEALRSEYQ